MALPHADSGQIVDLRPLGNKLSETASTALLKTNELEVMRLVLQAGKSIPEHHVPGEVTLFCLEGSIELTAHDKKQTLRTGDFVYLRGGEPHSLHALENAAILHTILLKHEGDDPTAPLRAN